jgi:hypothetical protein
LVWPGRSKNLSRRMRACSRQRNRGSVNMPYQQVFFHFVPGAFHLDILPGRKSCAGPKTY